MSWTAAIVSKDASTPGELRIRVRYTNGTATLDETYTTRGVPDPQWIPQTVTNKLNALEGQDKYTLLAGPVEAIPPVTPDEKRASFIETLLRLERLWNLLVVPKIIEETDPRITALQDAVKQDLAEYIDTL